MPKIPKATILYAYLLASGVKNIQEARLSIDDHLLSVAVLDGGIVLVNEVVLYQLDCQGGLADTSGCK